MTDNPNAPNNDGNTPIFEAAREGQSDVIKILAPLTDNPNAANRNGQTPMEVSKNKEISDILKSFIPKKAIRRKL